MKMRTLLSVLGLSLLAILPSFGAITTVNGVLAGTQPTRFIAKATSGTLVAGRAYSTWGMAGSPGAGSFDTTLNGVTLSSSTTVPNGAIPHYDPGSGNSYLAKLDLSASIGGLYILADRVWHNGGITITSTSAQTITSPTWPARDNAGTTNGDGIQLAAEVSAATGAGTPTINVSYTNSAGTAGHTATNTIATLATSIAGSTYLLTLQAGDTGVRSVQSITLSATWTSGTINLVAFRTIATLPIVNNNTPNSLDALTGGLPQLFNGSVPYLMFVPSATTANFPVGSYVETQG